MLDLGGDELVGRDIRLIAREMVASRRGVGLLIGAGMSIPSGGLPGSRLALELLAQGVFAEKLADGDLKKDLSSFVGNFPLEAIAGAVSETLPGRERGLQNLVRAVVFDGKPPSPNAGHAAFAAVAVRTGLRTIYTTNWDTLLEESLGMSARSITEGNIHDLNEESDKIDVIHLHGKFDDSMLIREEHLMDLERPLIKEFLADFVRCPFVFVGYSLSDAHLRSLYIRARNDLAQRRGKFDKRNYVVGPVESTRERTAASAIWEHRGASHIPLSAEAFFRQLKDAVSAHAQSDLEDKVAKRLGIELTVLKKKVNELVSLFPTFQGADQALRYLDAMTDGGR